MKQTRNLEPLVDADVDGNLQLVRADHPRQP